MYARYCGPKLHKTGYHVLVHYVSIIINNHNVNISPELGLVAVAEVPCANRLAICPFAELRLIQAVIAFSISPKQAKRCDEELELQNPSLKKRK
jgi:hypothetical protein